MEIVVFEKSVYGLMKLYVEDEKVAQALQMLTGKRTIDQDDISALKVLGIEVKIIPVHR